MSLINEIIKTEGAVDSSGIGRGWVLYFNSKDEIVEVKSLYNPETYKGARKVYTDAEIIDKLTKYKEI
tara:strand:- start:1407 stop:1610 length:204 start_codon:yes stop_codon:yes gene_type:complete